MNASEKVTKASCTAHFESLLRDAGIQPTPQRLAIAQVLLHKAVHCTADEVLQAARTLLPSLSRATVYNSLPLFVEKGLLRALRLDSERTIYDSRTDVHSHLYHEDTGLLEDLPPAMLHSMPRPVLPPTLELVGLDVIVHVRQSKLHETRTSDDITL